MINPRFTIGHQGSAFLAAFVLLAAGSSIVIGDDHPAPAVSAAQAPALAAPAALSPLASVNPGANPGNDGGVSIEPPARPSVVKNASMSSESGRSLSGKARSVAMQWLNRSGQRPSTKFGITLDDGAAKAPSDRPLVILIHGYNSSPERLTPLMETIRGAHYPCGAMRYPNDQPIEDSAALLSQELRRIAAEQSGRKVTLITHSMGGLVAREVIENPALDPGNVAQLIMLSPPSHGTSCAYITCSGDLWEHLLHSDNHNLLDCLYGSLEDGLGEARDELKPNSAFLKQLNCRQRNASVRYSIFLGTGSTLTPQKLAHARRIVEQCAQTDSIAAMMEPALQRVLDDFADAAQQGDGVVSVDRGRLEGVSDTVLLGFNHWNMIGEATLPPVAALHHEIVNRLGSAEVAVATGSAQ